MFTKNLLYGKVLFGFIFEDSSDLENVAIFFDN